MQNHPKFWITHLYKIFWISQLWITLSRLTHFWITHSQITPLHTDMLNTHFWITRSQITRLLADMPNRPLSNHPLPNHPFTCRHTESPTFESPAPESPVYLPFQHSSMRGGTAQKYFHHQHVPKCTCRRGGSTSVSRKWVAIGIFPANKNVRSNSSFCMCNWCVFPLVGNTVLK